MNEENRQAADSLNSSLEAPEETMVGTNNTPTPNNAATAGLGGGQSVKDQQAEEEMAVPISQHPLNKFASHMTRLMIIMAVMLMLAVGATVIGVKLTSGKSSQTNGKTLAAVPTQNVEPNQDITPPSVNTNQGTLSINSNLEVQGQLQVKDSSGGTITIKAPTGGTGDNQVLEIPSGGGTICTSSNNCDYATPSQLAASIAGIVTTSSSLVNNINGAVSLQGTNNGIGISVGTNGVITFTLPQDLAKMSSPTFASLLLTSDLNVEGNITGAKALAVNGNINGGGLVIGGNGSFGGDVTASSGTFGSANVSGDTTIGGDLMVGGSNITLTAFNCSSFVAGGKLTVNAAGQLTCEDDSTVSASGSGTVNYLTRWSAGNALVDSSIYDDGTFVGIGTTTNSGLFSLQGTDPSTTTMFVQGGAAAMAPTAVLAASAGQTGDLLQLIADGGAIATSFDSTGALHSTSGIYLGSLSAPGGSGEAAQLQVGTGDKDTMGIVIRGVASQVAPTLQIEDSNGNPEAYFSANGNVLTLGNSTANGTNAGSIRLADGTTDGYYGSLGIGAPNGGDVNYNLPGGLIAGDYTLCIIGTAGNCGFASDSGSGSYIQNIYGLTQDANFDIRSVSGSAVAGVIQSALAGTADVLQVYNNAGVDSFQITADGTTNTNSGLLSTVQNPTDVADTIRGTTSQTADLLQLQDVSGNVLSAFNAQGYLGIGSATPTSQLTVAGDNAAHTGTGTVSALGGTNTLNGFGTQFTTNLKTGDVITINSQSYVVSSITSDIQLSVEGNGFPGAIPNGSSYSYYHPAVYLGGGTSQNSLVIAAPGNNNLDAFVISNLQGKREVFAISASGVARGSSFLASGSGTNFGSADNNIAPSSNVQLGSGNSTAAGLTSGNVTITTGNASLNTGDISIDTGLSDTGTNGNIYIGTTNASSLSLGRPDVVFNLQGMGANLGDILQNFRVAGDTAPRFTVADDGTLAWGDGVNATDVNLTRLSTGSGLQLNGKLKVTRLINASSTGQAGSSIGNGNGLGNAIWTVYSSSPGNIAQVIQGTTSQTADLLQFQNTNGVAMSGFDANGNLYYTYGGYTSELSSALLTSSHNIVLPDADGVVCLEFDPNCGFSAGGDNSYIANQSTAAQTGNFWVKSGAGAFATGTLQSNGANDTLDLLDSLGNLRVAFDNNGTLKLQNSSADPVLVCANGVLASTCSAGTSTTRLGVATGSAGTNGITIMSTAGQTADLLQNQDSTGVVLSGFNANGGVYTNGGASVFNGLHYPATITLSNGGATGTTTYAYRVSAVNAQGETIASPEVTIANGSATLNSVNSVIVTFSPVAGAKSYKIYGRTVGGELYMATVNNDNRTGNYTWADDGSVTPLGQLPAGSGLGTTLAVNGGNTNDDIFDVNNGAGQSLIKTSGATNEVSIGSGTGATTRIGGGTNTATNTSLSVSTVSSSTVGVTLQGAAGQTADLFDLKSSSGSILARFQSDGTLGIGTGTMNPQSAANGSAITIGNGMWLTAVNSDGSGYVNLFSVNGNNEIQAGATIDVDGGIVLPTNAGQVTLIDSPVDGTLANGTAQSYSLDIGTANALTVYGEGNGSGGIKNIRVAIGASITPQYTLDVGGDINTSGILHITNASGFAANIDASALTAARNISLPDIAGTLCVQPSSGSGNCAPITGGTGYIQNQSATVQSGSFNIQAPAGQAAATIEGDSTKTANVLTVLTGDGNVALNIANNGTLTVNHSSTFNNSISVNNSVVNTNTVLAITNTGSGTKAVTIQGALNQSADLLQFQTNTGAVTSGFNKGGGYYTNGVGTTLNAIGTPTWVTASTGTSYYYVVQAISADGSAGVYSSSLGMTNNTSALQWNSVASAVSYNIYRNTTNSFASGSLLVASGITGTSYTDTGAATTAGVPTSTSVFRVNGSNGASAFTVNASGTAYASQSLGVAAASASTIGEYIQGAASQTADLFQIKDSSNNILARFQADGSLGVGTGTMNPQTIANGSAITIGNGLWITSVDASGTGYINMFSVNSNNQIQVGASLNVDGGITFPTDVGQVTMSDLPVDGNITAGTPESYTLRVGSTNALTVYGEGDGAGGIQNVRVAIGSSISPQYTLDVGGDANLSGALHFTNGSYNVSLTSAAQANNVALTIPADANTTDVICLKNLANCSGGTGGSYINNGTIVQNASFYVQGASGNVTAKIQGSDATSDIVDVLTSGGTKALYVDASGVLHAATAVLGGNTCTTTGTNNVVLCPSSTTAKPLVLGTIASQTSNELEVQDTSGNVLTALGANGFLGIGMATAPTTAGLVVNAGSTYGTTAVGGNACSATTTNYCDLTFDGGTDGVYEINNIGVSTGSTQFTYKGNALATINNTGQVGIGTGTTAPTANQLTVKSGSSTTIGELIQAASSQSADLLKIVNSGGVPLSGFTNTGQLYFSDGSTDGYKALFGVDTSGGALTASQTILMPNIAGATDTVCLKTLANCAVGGGGGGGGSITITGSPTSNKVARWTSSSSLGTGALMDDGYRVGVNTTTATAQLDVEAAATGNTVQTGIGTLSCTATSGTAPYTVTGSSTSFLAQLSKGDVITPASGSSFVINSIASDTSINTVSAACSNDGTTNTSYSGQSFTYQHPVARVNSGTNNEVAMVLQAGGAADALDVYGSGGQVVRVNNSGNIWASGGITTGTISNQSASSITGGNGGNVNISTGAGYGSGNTSGNLSLDVGTAGNSAVAGVINIGTANASAINLGTTNGYTSIAGRLGINTTSPQVGSDLTISNGKWISSVDSSGTGYVNMFMVNSSNQIQAGAAINVDGGILLPTDAGQVTLVDENVDSNLTAGQAQSYTLGIGMANALTVYGEGDGAGGIQNVRVAIGSSISPQYTLDVGGDINTSGSIHFTNSGFNTVITQATLAASQTLTIPSTGGTAAQFCLSTNNCNYLSGNNAPGYIWNGATTQVANMNIQGAGTDDVATFQAGASSGYILNLKDSSGTTRAGFSNIGTLTLRDTSSTIVACISAAPSSSCTGNGRAYFNTDGANNTGLTIQGSASQNADLLQLNNSSGTAITGFNKNGNLYYTNSGFMTTLSTSALTANQTISLPNASGTICLDATVNNCGYLAGTGTAGYVALWTGTGIGTSSLSDDGAGHLGINNIAATNPFAINTPTTSASTTGAQLLVATGADANNGIVVQGTASQTADLMQFQNGGGTVLARVAADGTIVTSTGFQTANNPSAATNNVYLRSGNAGASTSGNVNITSGNATGTTANSGNINIDSGTATGTTGTVNIGATNASAVTVGSTTSTTYLQGSVKVNGSNAYLSIGAAASAGKLTVQSGSTITITQVNRAYTSQTADLLQFQNSTGVAISGISASGNYYMVNSGYAAQLSTATLTANRTIKLPDASGTICLDATVNNCSYVSNAGGTANYIARWTATGLANSSLTDDGLGHVGINNATAANPLAINGITTSNPTTASAQLLIGTNAAASTGLAIQEVAGQTAWPFAIQNSAGANIAGVTQTGAVVSNGTTGVFQTADNATAATTNLVLRSGNSGNGTSGDITIDSGTATVAAGAIKIGTANATQLTLGNNNSATTLQGKVNFTGLVGFGTATPNATVDIESNNAAKAGTGTISGSIGSTAIAGDASTVFTTQLHQGDIINVTIGANNYSFTVVKITADNQLTVANAPTVVIPAGTAFTYTQPALALNNTNANPQNDMVLYAGTSTMPFQIYGASGLLADIGNSSNSYVGSSNGNSGNIYGSGNFVSGTGIFGTTNSTGTSTNVTIASGNSSSIGNSGNIVIQSGNAISGNSGNINIDSGTAGGSGTYGTINIGIANSRTINIGNTNTVLNIQGTASSSAACTTDTDCTVMESFKTLQGSGGALSITANGYMDWGDGSDPSDVNLYRSSVNPSAGTPGTGTLIVGGNLTVGAPGNNTSGKLTANSFTVLNKIGTNPAAIIQGASGQTTNLIQFQNSSGTTLANFTNAGHLVLGQGASGTGTQLSILPDTTSTVGMTITGRPGQTSSLIELHNSAGTILSGFDGSGNLFFNSPSGFTTALNSVYLSASHTINLPDEDGTLCIQYSSNCGFVAGGTNSFISNQTATAQSADFNISGTGTANVLQVVTNFDTASGVSILTVGGANSTSISLAHDTTVNGNTSVASGGSLTVAGGSTNLVGSTGGSGTATTISTGASSNVGEVIQGSSGQTADFLQMRDSNNDLLSGVNKFGSFYSYGTSNVFSGLSAPSFTTTTTGTAFYYEVTATNSVGETIGSTALGMANNTSAIAWAQVKGATGYNLYRIPNGGTFTSGNDLVQSISGGSTTSYTDTGASTTAGFPPTANTTGTPLTINGVTTANAGTSSAQLLLGTSGQGNVGMLIQAVASQTADLFEAQDSTGAILAKISATGDLTVKNANINGILTANGTLVLNGHLITGNTTGTTTSVGGANAGTGALANLDSGSDDTAGSVNITTGTGSAAGSLVTVTFATPYAVAPRVIISPDTAQAGGIVPYRFSVTTTGFTIGVRNNPGDAQAYKFDYFVAQ